MRWKYVVWQHRCSSATGAPRLMKYVSQDTLPCSPQIDTADYLIPVISPWLYTFH